MPRPACDEANAEVRASVRWQNFVIPILIVLGVLAAIYAVRIYLRDLTEISLLEKAEADRRLRPPTAARPRRQSVVDFAKAQYRRQSIVVVGRLEQLKARFKRKPKKDAKILFGIEVDPPSHKFPVKAGKLKIFVGFFQIFGNFRDAFVIKWSSDMQNIMTVSAKFNLVRLASATLTIVRRWS
jgi:hypothetical protein